MEKLNKFGFKVGLSSSGAYCFHKMGDDAEFYLRKDGTIKRSYDGDFFPTMVEAAFFLEDYIGHNYPPKLKREDVARAMNVPANFVLID